MRTCVRAYAHVWSRKDTTFISNTQIYLAFFRNLSPNSNTFSKPAHSSHSHAHKKNNKKATRRSPLLWVNFNLWEIVETAHIAAYPAPRNQEPKITFLRCSQSPPTHPSEELLPDSKHVRDMQEQHPLLLQPIQKLQHRRHSSERSP